MRTAMLAFVLTLVIGWSGAEGPANAAKVWDPDTAINLDMAGNDDPIAPSNIGDNGWQTRRFFINAYADRDHWVDANEAPPENEGYPTENLPYYDIDYSTDAPAPGSLVPDEDTFVYTAPDTGGIFSVDFTGTDRSQAVVWPEGGNRNDLNDGDDWWDDVDWS